MRASLVGLWIRSALVGPVAFALAYLAACSLILLVAAKRHGYNPRPVIPWLLGTTLAFTGLCLPYPNTLLEWPLMSWAQKLHAEHAVSFPETQEEQRRTVVMIFGGGVLPDGTASSTTLRRLHHALLLWQKIPSASLLLSDGGIGRCGSSEWYRTYLSRQGVPPAHILIESKAWDTHQNAQFCAEIIKAHDFRQIILVTSATHLPRSYLTARKHGMMTQVSAPLETNHPRACCPTWGSLVHLSRMLNEYVGMAGYKLMGWI